VSVAGLILALLAWKVGGQAFLDGLHRVTLPALVAATALGALATVCCAWRWRAVARGLGMSLSLREAALAYYRSTFLNVTVPGGVAGDVHRAVDHGRSAGDVSRGVRAVTWERAAGQAVQVIVTLAVVAALPSPARGWVPLAIAVLATAVLVLALLGRRASTRAGRLVRAAGRDLRACVLASPALPGVLVASTIVVACHTTTFVVAARAAGTDASLDRLVPVALLILAAMALPLSFAGWGPREGAAAWAFGAAGLGAAAGLTAAVVYGVLVLAASLPGAAVLVIARWRPLMMVESRDAREVVHG
jgi:uncharacterized membrane protein YbhN (UPF0104 family)